MSNILQDELEMRLMDVHFEFKTREDWIPHGVDEALRKATMVKEAKDKLIEAIEEYFHVTHLAVAGHSLPGNEKMIYHLGYYSHLMKEYERDGENRFPKD